MTTCNKCGYTDDKDNHPTYCIGDWCPKCDGIMMPTDYVEWKKR